MAEYKHLLFSRVYIVVTIELTTVELAITFGKVQVSNKLINCLWLGLAAWESQGKTCQAVHTFLMGCLYAILISN